MNENYALYPFYVVTRGTVCWYKEGIDYVLDTATRKSSATLNYQRFFAMSLSKGNSFNKVVILNEDEQCRVFADICESVSDRPVYRGHKSNPVSLLFAVNMAKTFSPTYKCFKLVDAMSQRHTVLFFGPEIHELAPHEEGYYQGLRSLLERVDHLCHVNGRKRTLLQSSQGDVFYKASEEWNNFDVMDIVSMCLIAYPQSLTAERTGWLIAFNYYIISHLIDDLP